MMETIIADNGSRFVVAAAAVAIGLLCLVAVLWIMRNRPSSPFIRGGKNRQPRLAVLDAAAVDTRRRLVLVRRDDVEHLIMIGGPTDIVIESRIVAGGDERPAVSERSAVIERKVAEPVAESRPAVREPVQQPAPTMQAEPVVATPVRPITRTEEQPVARVEPVAPMRVTAEQRPVAAPALAAEQRPLARPVAQPAPESPSITSVAAPAVNVDAAMNRPVAMAQAVQPQPIQMQPAQQLQRPAAIIQSQPQLQPQPAPATALSDFERLLDAEITGDLQRLGPATSVTPENRAPAHPGRQEPTLGAPVADGGHKEPTIEEEMNRMLADISAGRKP
ncbi:flagellar biosynthetic protein FliO [Ensifer adhaerens]|uniref:flagellar biosynthetic protein FliO n=1 Tax=Ensifer adhaerens TaxID=106592 RepID=UPI001C4E0954|nr:flagellar biosynthetic protein FliO [Ensifer adhaerens]MBW0370461.1 flagellar biosynthetic protein FliO [Ensifer adhaerens]UCM21486.1 flagellar biosynthetic protein FliO [Ensifer adhaerens]